MPSGYLAASFAKFHESPCTFYPDRSCVRSCADISTYVSCTEDIAVHRALQRDFSLAARMLSLQSYVTDPTIDFSYAEEGRIAIYNSVPTTLPLPSAVHACYCQMLGKNSQNQRVKIILQVMAIQSMPRLVGTKMVHDLPLALVDSAAFSSTTCIPDCRYNIMYSSHQITHTLLWPWTQRSESFHLSAAAVAFWIHMSSSSYQRTMLYPTLMLWCMTHHFGHE